MKNIILLISVIYFSLLSCTYFKLAGQKRTKDPIPSQSQKLLNRHPTADVKAEIAEIYDVKAEIDKMISFYNKNDSQVNIVYNPTLLDPIKNAIQIDSKQVEQTLLNYLDNTSDEQTILSTIALIDDLNYSIKDWDFINNDKLLTFVTNHVHGVYSKQVTAQRIAESGTHLFSYIRKATSQLVYMLKQSPFKRVRLSATGALATHAKYFAFDEQTQLDITQALIHSATQDSVWQIRANAIWSGLLHIGIQDHWSQFYKEMAIDAVRSIVEKETKKEVVSTATDLLSYWKKQDLDKQLLDRINQ